MVIFKFVLHFFNFPYLLVDTCTCLLRMVNNDHGQWGAAKSSETLVAVCGVFEKREDGEENLDALILCHHVACLNCDPGCNFCNVLLVVHTL